MLLLDLVPADSPLSLAKVDPMSGWLASNVVNEDELNPLDETHTAVVARMARAMEADLTEDQFNTAFEATKAEILRELGVVLTVAPADGLMERFASVLTTYGLSAPDISVDIAEASGEESEMTFQATMMLTVFKPLMRLTARDSNVQESAVRPAADFVVSAVLKHVQSIVRGSVDLPEIGGQKIVGTYVVAEFASPNAGQSQKQKQYDEDFVKLREEVCERRANINMFLS
jgi:hypothetical protein